MAGSFNTPSAVSFAYDKLLLRRYCYFAVSGRLSKICFAACTLAACLPAHLEALSVYLTTEGILLNRGKYAYLFMLAILLLSNWRMADVSPTWRLLREYIRLLRPCIAVLKSPSPYLYFFSAAGISPGPAGTVCIATT